MNSFGHIFFSLHSRPHEARSCRVTCVLPLPAHWATSHFRLINNRRVRSCGRRVKKNVKNCDLFIPHDDHVLTRIGRHSAVRARAPL